MAKATRADLRTSLQYKTDGALTVAADQDYYLDAGELELLPLWFDFDPDIFAIARQSVTTDANGIALLPVNWLDLLRIEDVNQNKYDNLEIDQRQYSTGYYAAGYDITSGKRKLQLINHGAVLASTAVYFYDRERALMASGTTAEPVYPLEFRDLIAYRGAQLYFEDQGPSFFTAAEARRVMFERRLADARKMYDRPNASPQFVQTFDPDANNSSQRIAGSLGYF